MTKIPQLRILATSFCGRKCIYCRPTGEGISSCESGKMIDLETALTVCRIYKKCGGSEVKITGGDPVFWNDLVTFVKSLKDLGFQKVEVITRNPVIEERLNALVDAGLDMLNFSLDTLDKKVYEKITGSNDFDQLLHTIRNCAKKIPTKINAVILKGINDDSVAELISFCESEKIKQLKLLDVIDDLQNAENGNVNRLQELGVKTLKELFFPLEEMSKDLKKKSISARIVYQGNLGHPMNEFVMSSGLVVIVKNSQNGAWYGSICDKCPNYPCHDALMALRLTSDGKLQYCLLNEKKSVSIYGLEDNELSDKFEEVLNVYRNAAFVN